MRPDLLDAEASIDWAVAQIPVLQERIVAWRRDKPYAIRIDTDSEPGKKLYRVCDIKPLDPIINAEAGAIVHSIRSSLDLLACALAARNGHADSTDTYFPIWKTEAAFLRPHAKNSGLEKIERLSQIDQNIIKGLRPYPGGNDLLFTLHTLDITRKHRRLLDTFVFPRGIGFEGFPWGAITVEDWRGFYEESLFISTPATVPDGKINVGLHIAFNEDGARHGAECAGALRDFGRLAYDILVLFAR